MAQDNRFQSDVRTDEMAEFIKKMWSAILENEEIPLLVFSGAELFLSEEILSSKI